MYNIINLIDKVDKVNYGIWNAALINSTLLAERDVVSYAVFPHKEGFSYPDVHTFSFKTTNEVLMFLEENAFNPSNTLVVSHGCWRWPTKVGRVLSEKGFKWMAVPHGMLEPWSMQQKKIKKKIYYHLIEKQLLKKADLIRTVSKPEFSRLSKTFGKRVVHIPNGINPTKCNINKPEKKPIRLLFMARLHHKKGIVQLLQGWLLSPLSNNSNYELQIAGPDDGELVKIQPLIAKCSNADYLGAVYNEQKDELLQNSHMYLLPSHSEGFPSSVLEAMDYGLLPLISEGCNFPEAFENNLVLELKPNAKQIAETLTKISEWPIETIIAKGVAPKEFVRCNYTNEIISNQLYHTLHQLLEY